MLQPLSEQLRAFFPAGTAAELRAQLSRSRGVTMVSGNLVGNARSEASGVSARVWQRGVCGFSSEAELSEDAARRVLIAASENAAFMDRRAPKGLSPLPAAPRGTKHFDRNISDPTQKQYIDFLRPLDEYITSHCKNLQSRTLVASADSMEKQLLTADALSGSSMMERSYIYVIMSAETASGAPVELFLPIGGLGTFDKNFTDPALLYEKIDGLYAKLMQKREGIYPDAGVQTVILGGELSGMVAHEAVGHTVEADLVLGGSVAGPCLGKQVASEKVSMVDFANEALGKPTPLPVFLDDEGIEATDATLIDHGVLVGYMNNRESAAHFGQKPCGNARAYAFSDEPLIRMRNTAILPGTDKLEDMIAATEHGYYLIDTNNGQADTTGEFMFGVCMGYEIVNGKLGRALLDTTISGVAFEMLKTVDMVSDELVWVSSGFCGKKQPMPVGLGGPAIRCKVTMGGR